jgi:hypothetical protein
MAFDSTILIKFVDSLRAKVRDGNFADALVASINTGNGLMQQRIFTRGQDVLGQSFGGYTGRKRTLSLVQQQRLLLLAKNKVQKNRARNAINALTPYERRRVLFGRQVGYKDLEFKGDLRRSIQVAIIDGRTVTLAFTTLLQANKARGQEQQITNLRNGRPGTTRGTGAIRIFGFSEQEKQEVKRQAEQLILQVLK